MKNTRVKTIWSRMRNHFFTRTSHRREERMRELKITQKRIVYIYMEGGKWRRAIRDSRLTTKFRDLIKSRELDAIVRKEWGDWERSLKKGKVKLQVGKNVCAEAWHYRERFSFTMYLLHWDSTFRKTGTDYPTTTTTITTTLQQGSDYRSRNQPHTTFFIKAKLVIFS